MGGVVASFKMGMLLRWSRKRCQTAVAGILSGDIISTES